jgi:ketosteroid isomerase-like protein
MSQENVEIVRRIYDGYLSGDYDAAFAAIDPAVEFDGTARPEGNVYHGHEGLAEALRTWTGTWEVWRLEVVEIIDAGDKAVAVERQSGRGRGSGVPLVQLTSTVFEFDGGKVTRMAWFTTPEAGRRAAGLSE